MILCPHWGWCKSYLVGNGIFLVIFWYYDTFHSPYCKKLDLFGPLVIKWMYLVHGYIISTINWQRSLVNASCWFICKSNVNNNHLCSPHVQHWPHQTKLAHHWFFSYRARYFWKILTLKKYYRSFVCSLLNNKHVFQLLKW